ncbi:MAG TPA: hypothetical protein VGE41_10070 [Verrucomicrobiae bacterium]|jgi:hypothetical protein
MKINLSKSVHAGSVLIVTLCTTLVIGIGLLATIQLGINQNQLTARSEIWNDCMPVLEAGLEEALTHCYYNSTNLASSGWTLTSGKYCITNTIGLGYYEVNISTNQPYIISSKGYYPMPGSSSYISRTVQVTTQVDPVIQGLIGKTGISMNGNGTLINRYDSRDPSKSTGGLYDPAKAGDKADVSSYATGNGSVDTGNGNIWGHAVVPPGATVTTGPNGAVGSKSWQQAGSHGVQSGWVKTDLNRTLPPVTVPFTAGNWPSFGWVGGTYYDSILSGGNYIIDQLNNKVLVTAPSSIWVQGKINPSKLVIKTNASLKMYCDGPSAKFSTIVNENISGPSMILYGLSGLTSINLSSDWTGGVYAPNADFSLAGSSELSGSIIANSISLKGSSAFHYDEAFSNTNNLRAWVVVIWMEL